MEASRRGSPGVLATSLLLTAMLRSDVLALPWRQRLVFGPLLAQLAALLRRQRGPALHAALHALLLLGLHRRIALGDADPLAAALGFQALPVGLERREGVLLLGGELGPRRTRRGLGLRRGLGGRLLGRDLGRDVDRRLGERCARQEKGEEQPCAAHHSSAVVARFFSQFWNPRSR